MKADNEFLLMVSEKLREISEDGIDSGDLRGRLMEFAEKIEETVFAGDE
jgi:hypothetical protein